VEKVFHQKEGYTLTLVENSSLNGFAKKDKEVFFPGTEGMMKISAKEIFRQGSIRLESLFERSGDPVLIGVRADILVLLPYLEFFLSRKGEERETWLFWGCNTTAELPFYEWVEHLAGRYSRFGLFICPPEPAAVDSPGPLIQGILSSIDMNIAPEGRVALLMEEHQAQPLGKEVKGFFGENVVFV